MKGENTMKNNRKIILLSVIVLIVAVGSATALAVFSGQTPQTASDISPQEAEQPVQTQAETAAPVIRTLQDGEDAEAAPAGTPATEVPQTRVAAAADGTQTQMTFVKQDPQLDGAMRYLYQDAKGDTYRFDGAGNLVGFEQKDFCFQPVRPRRNTANLSGDCGADCRAALRGTVRRGILRLYAGQRALQAGYRRLLYLLLRHVRSGRFCAVRRMLRLCYVRR